jgi:hypothetical protein
MAWDFSTDPQFQEKLDWVERFCQEKARSGSLRRDGLPTCCS